MTTGLPAPEDIVTLYRRAFVEYGARALEHASYRRPNARGCPGDYRRL